MTKNYNIRNGIQIGVGFAFGWFFVKFIGFIITVVVGFYFVGELLWGHEYRATHTAQTQSVSVQAPLQVTYDKGCWIRKRPTTKSRKVGVVKAGDTVTVISTHGHWLRTANGWIGCKPVQVIETPQDGRIEI